MNEISYLTEKAYYLLRAESELRMARRARHEAAARAHFMIAALCLDKAHRVIGRDAALAVTIG